MRLSTPVCAALLIIVTSSISWGQTKGPEEAWVNMDEEAFGGYVDQVRSTMRIPGIAVAVVHTDKGVVFTRGFGEVSEDNLIGDETPFFIGALTESFTAAAIVKLAQEGKLDLDKPVAEVLPDLSFEKRTETELTVRHLLHHVSGIPASQGHDLWLDEAAAMPALASETLPGERVQHSSLNNAILGKVVEAASGKSYGAYLKEALLDPLGMSATQVKGEGPEREMAPGHQYMFALSAQRAEPSHNRLVVPSAFVSSTASDMGRWLLWHLGGEGSPDKTILTEASMALLHDSLDGGDTGEAMGWTRTREDGRLFIERSGVTGSYSASMVLVPEHKLGIVVLANINSYEAMGPKAIRTGFVELLLTRTTKIFAFVEIVIRLVMGLLILMTFLDLLRQLYRWHRFGYPKEVTWTGKLWFRLALALGVPSGLFMAVMLWVEMPVSSMVTMQPDVCVALFMGSPLAMFKGVLKLVNDAYEARLVDPDDPIA